MFLWDHLQVFPEQLPWMDMWVLLGAIATASQGVRLGTMVSRGPWKLAKEAMTLDHLSGGRVILGIGLGRPKTTSSPPSGEIAEPRQRAALTDERLHILDRVPRGSRSSIPASTTRVMLTRNRFGSDTAATDLGGRDNAV